jgi:hypothetical protein
VGLSDELSDELGDALGDDLAGGGGVMDAGLPAAVAMQTLGSAS